MSTYHYQKGNQYQVDFQLVGLKHSEESKFTIPHRKQDCSDCDNRKICSDCVMKPEMNCFNHEIERACKSCLDLISRKKTYFTDINCLERKPPNENHQMHPQYENKQNNIDFDSAKEVLMEVDKKMFEKRRFQRIYNAIETMTYTKYEDLLKNKEMFFKHSKILKQV